MTSSATQPSTPPRAVHSPSQTSACVVLERRLRSVVAAAVFSTIASKRSCDLCCPLPQWCAIFAPPALEKQAHRHRRGSTSSVPRPTLILSQHSSLQVEYAIEAINNAGTCVGILAKDGIVMAAERKVVSKLLAPSKTSEKTYRWVMERMPATVFSGFDHHVSHTQMTNRCQGR